MTFLKMVAAVVVATFVIRVFSGPMMFAVNAVHNALWNVGM